MKAVSFVIPAFRARKLGLLEILADREDQQDWCHVVPPHSGHQCSPPWAITAESFPDLWLLCLAR